MLADWIAALLFALTFYFILFIFIHALTEGRDIKRRVEQTEEDNALLSSPPGKEAVRNMREELVVGTLMRMWKWSRRKAEKELKEMGVDADNYPAGEQGDREYVKAVLRSGIKGRLKGGR